MGNKQLEHSLTTMTSMKGFISEFIADLEQKRAVRINKYRADDSFVAWYQSNISPELPANGSLGDAISYFEQQQRCADICKPQSDIDRDCFRCRPNGASDDSNGRIWLFDGVGSREAECEHLIKHKREALERERQRLLDGAQIPPLYKNLSFDNYSPQNADHRKALSICRRYADEFMDTHTGLYLCGNVGVGKTHLAVSILREVTLNRGIQGYFARTIDALNRLRPPYSDIELMETMETIGLLVLDDIGTQKDTEWTYEQLTVIIDTRLVNMLPTIITSNLTLESLAKGSLECERIVSRIKQMCDVVLIRGDDYRDKIARDRRGGILVDNIPNV